MKTHTHNLTNEKKEFEIDLFLFTKLAISSSILHHQYRERESDIINSWNRMIYLNCMIYSIVHCTTRPSIRYSKMFVLTKIVCSLQSLLQAIYILRIELLLTKCTLFTHTVCSAHCAHHRQIQSTNSMNFHHLKFIIANFPIDFSFQCFW